MRQDYHTSIMVDATAHEAFERINSVSQWWTENLEGGSQKLNDVFTVHFGETYVTVKIVELIPDRKIAWHVIDCNKPWLKDKKEWKDTKMSWEIEKINTQTQIRFIHRGLIPEIECFDVCSQAWNQYIQRSLLTLITSGKGQPGKKETEAKADGRIKQKPKS